MPYPSLDDLKEYVAEPTVQTRHENNLQRALNSAIAKTEAYTDRYFGTDSVATARVFRPKFPDKIWIRDFWTTTDLVVATDEDSDGDYETTWSASDFEVGPVDQRTGYPYYTITGINRRFPWSRRSALQVTAKWGWAETPDDVITTVLELATTIWKRRDAPFGVIGFDDMGPVKISDSDRRVLVKVDYLKRHGVLVG